MSRPDAPSSELRRPNTQPPGETPSPAAPASRVPFLANSALGSEASRLRTSKFVLALSKTRAQKFGRIGV
jgi:hypothetical protein